MKRRVLISLLRAAAVLLCVMALGGVAFAKAQKLDLRANPPHKDVPGTSEAVAGFAVLNNDNETDEVVVVVSLKGGVANRTYRVYLEDYTGPTGGATNWKAWAYLGDLTTNVMGNGNFEARVSRPADTYYLQIVVSYPWGSWGSDSFGTDIATVTID